LVTSEVFSDSLLIVEKFAPGNRLEELKGSQKRQYSISTKNQWRIYFEWHENEAYNVEVVDQKRRIQNECSKIY
jgi:hypothetical protein